MKKFREVHLRAVEIVVRVDINKEDRADRERFIYKTPIASDIDAPQAVKLAAEGMSIENGVAPILKKEREPCNKGGPDLFGYLA